MSNKLSSKKLRTKIDETAAELGFDVCRVTSASLPFKIGNHLREFLDKNYHGSMNWLQTTKERRVSPDAMWSEAQSAIVLGMNYGPEFDPLASLERRSCGSISVYARHRDYHDVVKGKLKLLAEKLASWCDCEVKVFVDTAPVMEKPLAAQAGIGWQGKHTNLVSREFGSWLFLGVILTSINLDNDEADHDHCGSCRACLDVCPTDAFPAPYQLDASRCISYLTIEFSGMIEPGLRPKIGNRIYGCDDCLAVCPWNKFAQTAREAKVKAREDLIEPKLANLLTFDDATFRKFFSGSPIKRIGRNQFIRNVLIAAGNSRDGELVPSILPHLCDGDPVVRGAAIWALSRLSGKEAFQALKRQHLIREDNRDVLDEWQVEALDREQPE